MNNPVLFIDPDGRYVSSNSSFNAVGAQMDGVENEYVKDKETGEVVMVGTEGGDATDYVYDGSIEKDGDGNVSTVKWSESSAQVLDVKTEYTSGPGTWQGEKGVATPGERSVHGKGHTDLAAYEFLVGIFSGGATKGVTAAGLSPGQILKDVVGKTVSKKVKDGRLVGKLTKAGDNLTDFSKTVAHRGEKFSPQVTPVAKSKWAKAMQLVGQLFDNPNH